MNWIEEMLEEQLGEGYKVHPPRYKMDRILIGIQSSNQFVQLSYQSEKSKESFTMQKIGKHVKDTLEEFKDQGYPHELAKTLKSELPPCMNVDRVELERLEAIYTYIRKC